MSEYARKQPQWHSSFKLNLEVGPGNIITDIRIK